MAAGRGDSALSGSSIPPASRACSSSARSRTRSVRAASRPHTSITSSPWGRRMTAAAASKDTTRSSARGKSPARCAYDRAPSTSANDATALRSSSSPSLESAFAARSRFESASRKRFAARSGGAASGWTRLQLASTRSTHSCRRMVSGLLVSALPLGVIVINIRYDSRRGIHDRARCRTPPRQPGGAGEKRMAAQGDSPVASVLIVDDRAENLLALEAILKPLGSRIVKARSGEEALLHLLRETFAVILLDVQMPRLDGLQTAELIKQREQTRHIPIIFVTAFARETAYVFKAYARGAVDYLLKPLEPEILRAKVRVFWDLFIRGEQIRRQALRAQPMDVFFTSVVHELQTPLAAAKAQAQLALHQLDPRKETSTARALQIITQQIDGVARLVSDLLD